MLKKKYILLFLLCAVTLNGCKEPTLKSSLKGSFLIGVSMNERQIVGNNQVETDLIVNNFNILTPENCMKSIAIHPTEDKYDFEYADKFVEFALRNNMAVTGHTLIWDKQLAPWFCHNENGDLVSADVLKERMKEHITTIMTRYKGKIKGWDVVNEAFDDEGQFKEDNPFYQILGEDYIILAYKYAHEADPDAELYYDDYSMTLPGRQDAVIRMIGKLNDAGIKLSAVGVQAHWSFDYPAPELVAETIEKFAAAGVKVNITEFDFSILPSNWTGAETSMRFPYSTEMDPYKNGVPTAVMDAWTKRMEEYFEVFFEHSDVIGSVNMWGLADGDSWRNTWPIFGRTDYPVLFDRTYQPKEIVSWIIENAK